MAVHQASLHIGCYCFFYIFFSLPLFFLASIFARPEFERWNYFIQTITFVRGSGGGVGGCAPGRRLLKLLLPQVPGYLEADNI